MVTNFCTPLTPIVYITRPFGITTLSYRLTISLICFLDELDLTSLETSTSSDNTFRKAWPSENSKHFLIVVGIIAGYAIQQGKFTRNFFRC